MTLAAYSRASLIIASVNLGYSSMSFFGVSPAAINSTISPTRILVPLKVGFPWQISVSATICLLISTLITVLAITEYLKGDAHETAIQERQKTPLVEVSTQALERAVLEMAFGLEPPRDAVEEQARQVDANTRAPAILECVKGAYGADRDAYLEWYIAPTLINPKLHEAFSTSAENGAIAVGDRLAASPTRPGYAVKAMQPGRTIGMALESYDGSAEGSGDGKIKAFLNLRLYGG